MYQFATIILNAFFVYFAVVSLATAADCEPGQFRSKKFSDLSNFQKIAYLNTVTNKQLESSDREFDTNFEYFEVIGGDTQNKEFKKKMSDVQKSTGFNSYKNYHKVWAESALDPIGLEAYRECLRTAKGLFMTITSLSNSAASLKVEWFPTKFGSINKPPEIIGVYNIKNVDDVRRILGNKAWGAVETAHEVTIEKIDESKEAYLTIKMDTFSEALYIPAPVVASKTKPSLALKTLFVGSCIGSGRIANVRFWGPVAEYCNGISGWGRYDAQVFNAKSLGSCIGKGSLQGVRLYGPIGKPCGGFAVWGNYVNPVSVADEGISSCKGSGNMIGGHDLWGPHDLPCGGIGGGWGNYVSHNKRPTAQ